MKGSRALTTARRLIHLGSWAPQRIWNAKTHIFRAEKKKSQNKTSEIALIGVKGCELSLKGNGEENSTHLYKCIGEVVAIFTQEMVTRSAELLLHGA